MIEMILLEINSKLKEEKIDKKKVKNYSDIYSLSLENLEEILKGSLSNSGCKPKN